MTVILNELKIFSLNFFCAALYTYILYIMWYMVTVTPWWQIVLVVVNVLFAAGLAAGIVWTAIDEVRAMRRKKAAAE